MLLALTDRRHGKLRCIEAHLFRWLDPKFDRSDLSHVDSTGIGFRALLNQQAQGFLKDREKPLAIRPCRVLAKSALLDDEAASPAIVMELPPQLGSEPIRGG
jgi:hypothetical protein